MAAFTTSGFVSAVNHGVPSSARHRVFEAARTFFSAPENVRTAVHYHQSEKYRGYVPFDDPDSPSPLKQSYDCGLQFADDYDGPGARLRSSRNLWPELPGFRDSLENYLAEMRSLADAVLCMIVTGLGWPSDYFLCRCDKPTAQLRILHYPTQVANDSTLSVGPHSDYEALTILAQDDVGGLQIRRPDRSWVDVVPIPDAFVLNIGEMLTMWTNGLLPATLHRVRTPHNADRYSVAFFYGTNYDAVIEPPAAELASGSARYEPTTAGEYLERRLSEVGG